MKKLSKLKSIARSYKLVTILNSLGKILKKFVYKNIVSDRRYTQTAAG